MGKEITELLPKSLWTHFYEFTQIPRPSKHEEAVINYIKSFAKHNNLDYNIDEVGNIIVKKPATPGMEDAPGVILQSHVDMVPQKNSSKQHNFETDVIETLIDGEWIKANETTLGADNGIGCAAMISVLESNEAVHGSLEALFTINEEAGMEGAFGLKPDALTGKILINLDSEDEGELFVGCAGGINAQARAMYSEENLNEGKAFKITIEGLKGGHSGMDIILGRGNSNKLMGRLLWSAMENLPIRLAEMEGGDLRNAIPREAHALVVIPDKFENDLKIFVEQFERVVKEELKLTEPDLKVAIETMDYQGKLVSEQDVKRIIGILNAAPNGVVRMSDEMPGVCESSLNLAIVKVKEGVSEFFYLIRSSVDTAKYAVADQVSSLHQINGFEIGFSGDYPGWRPNSDSYVLNICSATYQQMFNKKPGLLAIHAGLECGIIGGKYSGLDMISFGPTIRFPHSPDEKVHIKSVEKFYSFLLAVLREIK
jgi:dipeptidase D